MRLKAAISSIFRSGQGKRLSPDVLAPAASGIPAFDALAPDYVNNPYAYLTALQDSEPVHKAANGTWVLTRYEDVRAAFSDRRLGNIPSPYAVVNARNCERYTCAQVANNIIPFKDAPAHNGPRKFLSKTFHKFMNQSPPNIEKIAAMVLEARETKSEIDLLSDFATPLSVKVMSCIMGIPEEDQPQLKNWSEWFFYLFSIIPSEHVLLNMNQALDEFRAYFRALIAKRRKSPGDDLLSLLANCAPAALPLSDAELVDHCMLFFSDGVENVDSGIANAVHALLKAPDQLHLLATQPSLCRQAVDECLRFESPGQFIGRVALEDIQLHGTNIKQGSGVLLIIGAANRDPREFTSPHELDIRRSPNPYLSFGKGKHACIGASLVKLEMEAAFKVLLKRLPPNGLPNFQAEWESRLGHRWISRLPVTLSPADL